MRTSSHNVPDRPDHVIHVHPSPNAAAPPKTCVKPSRSPNTAQSASPVSPAASPASLNGAWYGAAAIQSQQSQGQLLGQHQGQPLSRMPSVRPEAPRQQFALNQVDDDMPH